MTRPGWPRFTDRRSMGPTLTAAVTAAVLIACPGRDTARDSARAVADSSDAGTRAAAAAPGDSTPKGGGQQAGTAGGGGGGGNTLACAGYDTSKPDEVIVADPRRKGDWQKVYDASGALCFATNANQIDTHIPDPGNGQPIPVWIQPELRMHNSTPDDLKAGEGMVVGKILNLAGKKVKLKKWKHEVGNKTDALVWFGKDGKTGAEYSVLFVRVAGGTLDVVSEGTWVQEHKENGKQAMAIADWNPEDHRGTKDTRRQQSGSGWFSCLPGCCTPLSLNVDP